MTTARRCPTSSRVSGRDLDEHPDNCRTSSTALAFFLCLSTYRRALIDSVFPRQLCLSLSVARYPHLHKTLLPDPLLYTNLDGDRHVRRLLRVLVLIFFWDITSGSIYPSGSTLAYPQPNGSYMDGHLVVMYMAMFFFSFFLLRATCNCSQDVYPIVQGGQVCPS
ncbi:hypothetical protein LZ32DRAFT_395150 [Colletotrichum eremochloae]|nr:hypothetical protein LZ32DRAFT_395150 [Colletotrichum eremochloae]